MVIKCQWCVFSLFLLTTSCQTNAVNAALTYFFNTLWSKVCVFCVPAIPVGIVVVRGDCDLETCRLYIDRLQEASFHYAHHHFDFLLAFSLLLLLPRHHYFTMHAAASLHSWVIFGWISNQHRWECWADLLAVCLMWETFTNRANICGRFWCKCLAVC